MEQSSVCIVMNIAENQRLHAQERRGKWVWEDDQPSLPNSSVSVLSFCLITDTAPPKVTKADCNAHLSILFPCDSGPGFDILTTPFCCVCVCVCVCVYFKLGLSRHKLHSSFSGVQVCEFRYIMSWGHHHSHNMDHYHHPKQFLSLP